MCGGFSLLSQPAAPMSFDDPRTPQSQPMMDGGGGAAYGVASPMPASSMQASSGGTAAASGASAVPVQPE